MEMFHLKEDGTVDEAIGNVYESCRRKIRPEDKAKDENITINEKDGGTGIDMTEQVDLDILRSFPLPKTATIMALTLSESQGAMPAPKETLEGDQDDEVLSQLLAKQKELVAMERAMEPHLRNYSCQGG